MSQSFDLADLKRRMDGAIAAFKGDLAGLRTGRASPSLLDPIMVEAYGSQMPINQVYNALQTGLIDGVITGASTLSDFKLDEVANSYTLGANLGRLAFYTVMGQSSYDKLSPDAKAAVDAVAGMEVSKSAEMAWNATADAALEAARADDTNVVIDLSPEEAQAFADAVADVVNGYVAEVNGEAALAKMRGE